MNAIAQTEFNPYLAIINGVIKTTSLKVAEHFGKQHKNVLQAIDRLECSLEFNQLNFQPVEYSDAKGEKRPAYEMTKDGFTFLAMGFTGKEAAKWKEAYINAFNAMAIQLSTNPLQLPEAKTKKALANGLTLDQQDTIKALVNGRAEGQPKDKQARIIIQGWSAIKKKFELSKTQTYKNIEPENFVNIISLITRLPIEGELVEKPEVHQHNSITINLAPLVDFKHRRWLVTQALDEMTILMALTRDQEIKSKEQFIDDLIKEGYIVIKRDELLGRFDS